MNIHGYKQQLKKLAGDLKLELAKQVREQNKEKLYNLNQKRIKLRDKIRFLEQSKPKKKKKNKR